MAAWDDDASPVASQAGTCFAKKERKNNDGETNEHTHTQHKKVFVE